MMMAKPENAPQARPEYWWFLFGIKGLAIDADINVPAPLIFGDSTIVSKKIAQQFLSSYSRTDRFPIGLAEAFLSAPKVTSVIAVRRLAKAEYTQEKLLAETRFQEILATLTLYSFMKSRMRDAYDAAVPPRLNMTDLIALPERSLEAGVVSWQHNNFVDFPVEVDLLSHSQLINEIRASEWSKIFELMLREKDPQIPEFHKKLARLYKQPHIHESIRAAIVVAGMRLVTAMRTQNPGDILAGAITSLEVLLNTTSVADSSTKSRLSVVSGFSEDSVQEIYHGRNAWMHAGLNCSVELARTGFAHVMITMKYFVELADMAPPQTTHSELLQWIDLHAFVRARDKEIPGQLKILCTHLDNLEPFKVNDSIRNQSAN